MVLSKRQQVIYDFILFYETNSVDYFKRIFIEQFKFAVEKYF